MHIYIYIHTHVLHTHRAECSLPSTYIYYIYLTLCEVQYNTLAEIITSSVDYISKSIGVIADLSRRDCARAMGFGGRV